MTPFSGHSEPSASLRNLVIKSWLGSFGGSEPMLSRPDGCYRGHWILSSHCTSQSHMARYSNMDLGRNLGEISKVFLAEWKLCTFILSLENLVVIVVIVVMVVVAIAAAAVRAIKKPLPYWGHCSSQLTVPDHDSQRRKLSNIHFNYCTVKLSEYKYKPNFLYENKNHQFSWLEKKNWVCILWERGSEEKVPLPWWKASPP